MPRFDRAQVAREREPARAEPETPAAESGWSAGDRSLAVHRSGTIARIFGGRLARLLAAAIAVVLALLLRVALERRGIALPTYITFYPAVILAALLGGMWAGLLATAISALLVDYLLLPPIGQFAIHSTSDIVGMAIFCISGVSISLVTELYHRRGEKLAAYRIEAAILDERRKVEEAQARAESIRAERQRFLDVLETLPTMISLLTPDHRIAFANRSFRERFGPSQGQPCYEARFGRTEPCDFCESYTVLETGQPHHWEVILPDGSLIDAYDYPFTDLDGSSLILEMDTDITERRREETELKEYREGLESQVAERTRQLQTANTQLEADMRERERAERVLATTLQRFYAILSNLSSGILLVTNEGRIEFANQAFCDFLHIKESPAELVERFDSAKVMARLDTAYENPEQAVPRVREILARGQSVSGEEIPMQNGARFLRDYVPLTVDGKSYGRMWVHTDITELKRKEEALRESRAKFEAALANMADSVIITDAEGRFVEFNDAFATFYRFKSKAECARNFDEFASIFEVFMANGEPAPREMYAIQRALRGEAATGAEYTLRRKDTGESWIGSISFSPIRDKDGAIIGSVITARDITDAKRAEEALQRAEKMAFQRQQLQALAERLQQAREEERKMVARDLHDDIGQILTAIKMDMTWAVRHLPRSNDEVRDRLKGSIELINDGVRSVRKICSGLRPGILDDLGLAAAVEWQSNEFAARAGILCEVSVHAGELRLDSDRATAIFRIYQECLTNVARHAEARAVSTSLYRQDENILLVVHDDGKGFNESEVAGSLGVLGMKERAQACGGSVQVSSSPGEGTTITVCVPLQASSAEQGQLAHTDSR
jgi:PAS domain S-box-containing protein